MLAKEIPEMKNVENDSKNCSYRNGEKKSLLCNHSIDFFIADEMNFFSFRDEIISMEYPFFALKAGDVRDREYKYERVVVTIKPNSSGMATIFDKDILIYAISKLQEALNNGEPISRTVCFTPCNFFISTNRAKGGRAYKDMEKALNRLVGTRIITNIMHSENKHEVMSFGLIDSWRILDEKKGKLDVGMVEVTLPDWLYQALYKNRVLKINREYFQIRKAIDRRIYEIARKHCGNQVNFSISFEKLYIKTGSIANKSEFKRMLRRLSREDNIPDYRVEYGVDSGVVVFSKRSGDERNKQISFKIKFEEKREK